MIPTAKLRVLLGGTFDPVHNGHLRAAVELCESLGAQQVDLVPARDPVHRGPPGAPALARKAMLELAVQQEPCLSVNAIELEADRESYTLFTLQELREEIGSEMPLVLVMGMDAFLDLETWKGWRSLLDYSHLLVMRRPGYQPVFSSQLESFYMAHCVEQVNQLLALSAGKICLFEQTPLEVSATQVRDIISSGHNPRYLVPDSVWDYIQENELYGFTGSKVSRSER